jgi:hypothetical protein
MGKRLPKSALLEEIRVERSALDAILEQLTPWQMSENQNLTVAHQKTAPLEPTATA